MGSREGCEGCISSPSGGLLPGSPRAELVDSLEAEARSIKDPWSSLGNREHRIAPPSAETPNAPPYLSFMESQEEAGSLGLLNHCLAPQALEGARNSGSQVSPAP